MYTAVIKTGHNYVSKSNESITSIFLFINSINSKPRIIVVLFCVYLHKYRYVIPVSYNLSCDIPTLLEPYGINISSINSSMIVCTYLSWYVYCAATGCCFITIFDPPKTAVVHQYRCGELVLL